MRVDPSSGQVLAQRNLDRAGELAAVEAGGSVWILQRSKEGARLIDMAPQTLAIRHRRAFAAAAEGLAATDGHLWLGVGTALTEIDPTTGRTVDQVPLPHRIDLVAGDPDGGLLYVTLEGPVRKDQAPLLELDGSSGGLIAHTRAGYADLGGVSQLVPAPNGVWVGEPTGMMGTLGFYKSNDLVAPQGIDEGKDGHGIIHGANSITGAYAGSHLWVAYGEGTVTCNDARNGRRLGTLTDDGARADIVTVGDHPMTVVDSTLYAIDEEIACS
ncbi:MAG: hypothetical protein ACXWFU_03670 [Actinomycetota bacterium]